MRALKLPTHAGQYLLSWSRHMRQSLRALDFRQRYLIIHFPGVIKEPVAQRTFKRPEEMVKLGYKAALTQPTGHLGTELAIGLDLNIKNALLKSENAHTLSSKQHTDRIFPRSCSSVGIFASFKCFLNVNKLEGFKNRKLYKQAGFLKRKKEKKSQESFRIKEILDFDPCISFSFIVKGI